MEPCNVKVGQTLNLKIIKDGVGKGKSTRRVKGKVTTKTSSFIVLDNGKYKESFSFIDFTCGKAIILNV